MSVHIEFKQPDNDEQERVLSFQYGNEVVQFRRRPRSTPTQRVLIKVQPSCEVVVHAPESASDTEVLRAVKKRQRWIFEQLRQFKEQSAHLTPRRFVSGESHFYLGKQYLLKVIESKSPEVKLLRGKLEVHTPSKAPERIQHLLNHWYKGKAKDVFLRRLDAVIDEALWVTDRPTLAVRTMKTRWGSCSPNGRITLNPHLVRAPRECVDYVILHELCHLAEHNHSERFYRLMNQVMPGWEKVKSRLDGMAFKLLNGLD